VSRFVLLEIMLKTLSVVVIGSAAKATFGTSWKGTIDGEQFQGGVERDAFTHNCVVRDGEPELCTMHHFWAGGNFVGYEDSIVRYYVDNETLASVAIPFSLGLGSDMLQDDAPWNAGALFGKTGQPSGVFHNYHIPFSKTIRVTVELGGPPRGEKFWIILKGSSGLAPRIDGELLPLSARARSLSNAPRIVANGDRMGMVESSADNGALLMTTLAVNWSPLPAPTPTPTPLPMPAPSPTQCTPQQVGAGSMDLHGGDLGKPQFAADLAQCKELCCQTSSCIAFTFEKETDVQTTKCNKGGPCCFLKKQWVTPCKKSIADSYVIEERNRSLSVESTVDGFSRSTGSLSFLEGCVRMEGLDGSLRSTISSGTEDYFLGTYYFNRGKYANPVAGLTDLDKNAQQFSAYRIFDSDPLYFEDGLNLTWRNGDPYMGCDLNKNSPSHPVLASSYALVYEWPHAGLKLL